MTQACIEALESRRLLAVTMTLQVIDGSATEAGAKGSATEAGANDAIVRFTRTGEDISQRIDAKFSVSGTATYFTDYFFANESSLSFPIAAGQSSADLIVRAKPDNDTLEGTETVHFQLENSAAYVVGSPNSGDVTILDGPALPTVTLSVIDGSANEAGTDDAIVDAIVRFTRTGGDMTVDLNVQYTNPVPPGTADYLTDYFFPNDSNHNVVIAVGQSSVDLNVRGMPDNLMEGNETVHLVVSPNSAAYQIGSPDSADVTIVDAAPNAAPTGVNDLLPSSPEDATVTIAFATLLANDNTGPAIQSGQTLTITSVSSPVGGTVAISGTNVIFTPSADYNGPASFVYTLQDDGTTNGAPDPKTSTATASFTITAVNDDPVQAILNVIAEIDALDESDVLSHGEASNLIAKLAAAINQLDAAHTEQAIHLLELFIDRADILQPEQQELIDDILAVIEALQPGS